MTTLPKYSFISNDAIHRAEGKWSEGLIYSPTLLAFLSQKDHYVLKIKDVVYVGEMIGLGSDVPLWQALRPLPPGTNVIEFKVLIIECHERKEWIGVTKKCSSDQPCPIGMNKVVSTNLHIWCCLEEVVDIAFVRHASVIENGVCTFGGKGVENSFSIDSQNMFCIDHNGDLKVECCTLNPYIFLSFAHLHSPSYFPHSYNYRIYIGLCQLCDHFNRILHTKRMFQKNGFRSSISLSVEVWKYLECRLKETTTVSNYEVSKVRRLFLDNLSQHKKRFHDQCVSRLVIDTQESLQSARRVLGSSFGVGVRVVPRIKDKVIVLGVDQHLNAVWPPSVANLKVIMQNRQILKRKGAKGIEQGDGVVPGERSMGMVPDGMPVVLPVVLPVVPIVGPMTNDDIASCSRKLDVIQITFDHTTSTAAISIVFTRMKVGGDIECMHVLKSISHNKMLSVINNVVIDVGKRFSYQERRWQVELIDGNIVYGSAVEGDGNIVVDKNNCTNIG